MNNNELNAMLNEMDSEERELVLAADDAYDRLYAYKLHKEFGVTVECNPGGDRTKVVIDGKVMNQEQFAAWLMSKRLAAVVTDLEGFAHASADDEDDEEPPREVAIAYDDLPDDFCEEDIKAYLRDTYDHYLARGSELDIDDDADDDAVYVHNIAWGRKR